MKNANYRHIFNEEPSKTANPQDVSSETKIARGRTSEMEGRFLKEISKLMILVSFIINAYGD